MAELEEMGLALDSVVVVEARVQRFDIIGDKTLPRKKERVAKANASTNVARAALEVNESTAGVRRIC